jgi:GTP cyclohydrolase-4
MVKIDGFPSSEHSVDLQESRPKIQLKLTRVGVKNLTIELRVSGKGGTISLFPTIELYVDLPGSKRGVHLSRDPESLYEVLEKIDALTVYHVEDFCEMMVRNLLGKHDYATRAEIKLQSTYVIHRQVPDQEVVTQEPFEILATATALRQNDDMAINRAVGVKVIGFTACPCTQELLKTLTRARLKKMGYDEAELSKILEILPVATHTQRTKGFVLLTIPKGDSVDVEELAGLVEESMSGKTYTILKRPAEASVVENAHKKTMFTEDVVREVLLRLSRKYKHLPDSVDVFVQMQSSESIHKHDVIAERTTTLGEIREEMKNVGN